MWAGPMRNDGPSLSITDVNGADIALSGRPSGWPLVANADLVSLLRPVLRRLDNVLAGLDAGENTRVDVENARAELVSFIENAVG